MGDKKNELWFHGEAVKCSCGSTSISGKPQDAHDIYQLTYTCDDCGRQWSNLGRCMMRNVRRFGFFTIRDNRNGELLASFDDEPPRFCNPLSNGTGFEKILIFKREEKAEGVRDTRLGDPLRYEVVQVSTTIG